MMRHDDLIPEFATAANRPSLYLIYLVFFFIPWLFMPVGTVDVVVALVAIAVFVPLHYLGFTSQGPVRLWTIAAFVTLAVATAPFVNGNSVFYIYAAASAGFVRPVKVSALVFALCAAVYVASAWFFDRHLLEITVALILSVIIWLSCFSDGESINEKHRLERARALDLQQASLIERERIARDLHDLLGHTLTLVSLKADLARRLIDSDPQQARAELDTMQATSRQALHDVRAALSGLTETSVVQELANAEVALEAAGVALTVSGELPRLDNEQDTAFGLLLRESVTNIIRHSTASAATIQFGREDDVHTLVVSDNGVVDAITEGSGLSGLRARLEGLGGMLSVNNKAGMQLRALLPL